jgi:hypothetical protein
LVYATLFQLGWLAAVLGGDLPGLMALMPMLICYGWWFCRDARGWLFLLAAAAMGIVIDSLLIAAGVLVNANGNAYLPLWLACIWLMFASCLSHVFSWLHERLFWASLLGAVFAPLSYWSGVQLGSMAFGFSVWTSLLVFAGIWALLMPLLVWSAGCVFKQSA